MKTRKQYINGDCTHDEYYGQFVSRGVILAVERMVGATRIVESQDQHFNDIPLHVWDALNAPIRHICGQSISEANGSGGISLSDTVCVAKQAAKQIKEGATN